MKRLLFILPLLLFWQVQGQKVLPVVGPPVKPVVAEEITAAPYGDDFQAVYDAFTTKPSSTYGGYWNTMVESIGTYWDSLDVFYFYAVHTNGDGEALINWTNPGTYDATAYNAPTFTAYEGFTGDGSSAYIDCNWNPSANGVNFVQNSASAGCYVRTNKQEDRAVIGVVEGLNGVYIYPRDNSYVGDKILSKLNDDTYSEVSNTDSRGMFITSRLQASDKYVYKNASGTQHIETSTSIPNLNLFALAINSAGSPCEVSTNQISCAFAGAGLSQTAVNVITDAIETCMDSMSKGIIP